MKRFSLFGVFAVIGLLYWGWDATHHDHEEAHGTPMTLAQIQNDTTQGSFTTDDGQRVDIAGSACTPEEGDAKGSTHFRCNLRFANGKSDEVIVHVLERDLMFISAEATG